MVARRAHMDAIRGMVWPAIPLLYSPLISQLQGVALDHQTIYRGEFLCSLRQAMMRIRYVEPRFIVGVRVFLNVRSYSAGGAGGRSPLAGARGVPAQSPSFSRAAAGGARKVPE